MTNIERFTEAVTKSREILAGGRPTAGGPDAAITGLIREVWPILTPEAKAEILDELSEE